jgi:hypothetical protein
MSGAFLLVTVATILFDMGSTGSIDATVNAEQYGASQGIAIGLLTFGGIICCYAVFVYYRRLRLLESRQPFGYHDRHGPVLLATALLVGIAMLLLYFSDAFGRTADATSSRPTLRSDGQLCTQQDLRGVQLLQYQPSDVLPLADRPGVMLVPSLSQITSVSIVKREDGTSAFANVQVVADVADADMEAITQVGERIFAVSEGGNKKSNLLEFRWKSDDESSSNGSSNNIAARSTKLELVSSAKIASPLVEGLAFVDGDLYVAGNRFDERSGLTVGSIDVYPNFVEAWSSWHAEHNTTQHIGTGGDDNTLTGHRLNSKLLDHGIVDSKIGALYYFEDILYILYDNAQLVRGWRLATSEQVLEWTLPSVPGAGAAGAAAPSVSLLSSSTTTSGGSAANEYDKQWEGLAVERLDQQLVLHLTLDSPPQIWTLQLVEKTTLPKKDGAAAALYPTLPECATRP